LILNDSWKFTFDEFAAILAQAPKSYNNKFFNSEQRYLDSIRWIEFIRTFLAPKCKIQKGTKKGMTWEDFINIRILAIREELNDME
jgi:hypothetical protein